MKNVAKQFFILSTIFLAVSCANSSLQSTSLSPATMQTFLQPDIPFTFSYPENWTVQYAPNAPVTVLSPESMAARKDAQIEALGYQPDIVIYYYPTVADEPNNKANNIGAENWEDLVNNDRNIMVTGEVQIAGKQAIAVVQLNNGEIFAYYIPNGDALYVVQFPHRKDSVDVSDMEMEIVNSLKLLK